MSHTKLIYHCTFSTEGRVAALYDDMRPRLHSYIAGMINNDFGIAREVNGIDDHVHILCDIRPNHSVSDVMSKLKSQSSGWIHQEFANLSDVFWQEGYSAFSVSKSVAPKVKEYIQRQEEHHRRRSFVDELRVLLEKHDIEYDPEYLV
ncbi:MAG: IS200/IS605 family transposase [Candidatus Brocadiia bacterium]